jgi:hypothetical protein
MRLSADIVQQRIPICALTGSAGLASVHLKN